MPSAPYVCGWCLGAASSADGTDLAHCRCRGKYGTVECACAAVDHVPTTALLERMAGFCHMTPELVQHYHEHQRGEVSKAQVVAQLLASAGINVAATP